MFQVYFLYLLTLAGKKIQNLKCLRSLLINKIDSLQLPSQVTFKVISRTYFDNIYHSARFTISYLQN